jgi:hypothetical protein
MEEKRRSGLRPVVLPTETEEDVDLFVSRFVGSTPSASVARDRVSSDSSLNGKRSQQSNSTHSENHFHEDQPRSILAKDIEKGKGYTMHARFNNQALQVKNKRADFLTHHDFHWKYHLQKIIQPPLKKCSIKTATTITAKKSFDMHYELVT